MWIGRQREPRRRLGGQTAMGKSGDGADAGKTSKHE
jgi:hypothetical protein